jgi:hypothetical protein
MGKGEMSHVVDIRELSVSTSVGRVRGTVGVKEDSRYCCHWALRLD